MINLNEIAFIDTDGFDYAVPKNAQTKRPQTMLWP